MGMKTKPKTKHKAKRKTNPFNSPALTLATILLFGALAYTSLHRHEEKAYTKSESKAWNDLVSKVTEQPSMTASNAQKILYLYDN